MKILRFSEKTVVAVLLLIGLCFRMYRFSNPVADWHSFRQADTVSVTREYVKHGIDLLHPKYHDVSNIASGFENLEGYRMVEFPFINALVAFIVRLTKWDLVSVSRIVSILLSSGAGLALHSIVRRFSGKAVALTTLGVFATLPYSVFYGRVILPEPGLLFFSTSAIALWDFWLRKGTLAAYVGSLVALCCALLLKPFALFLAPVFFVLTILHKPKQWYKSLWIYLYPTLALIPLIAWRRWILQFPEGIPVSNWLFNEDGIRFRPAWFRWLFFERYSKLVGGYIGLPLSILNLLQLKSAETLIYGAWWIGILAYFAVIATGNVRHDYYQVMALPIFVITISRGLVLSARWLTKLLQKMLKKPLTKATAKKVLALTTLLMYVPLWLLAWQEVRGYFNVNHWEYVRAGQAVQRVAPEDALVIAPAFGDTVFLLQTDRRGWAIGFDIPHKIEKGAAFYVTTSYDDEAHELEALYTTVEKTTEYLLLDLRKPL